jgi:hypothetical protein
MVIALSTARTRPVHLHDLLSKSHQVQVSTALAFRLVPLNARIAYFGGEYAQHSS